MIIDELFEGPQLCPECGGISFSDLILAEKKDACYYKVKASAKVWPSAYASGRLVQCRKKGAANYGNKSEGVAEEQELDEKWSQKYKSSINCANPKGFSQKAHCAGRKKNEDVAEAKPPGSRRDPLDLPPLEGPGPGSGHQVPQFTVPIIPDYAPGGSRMPMAGRNLARDMATGRNVGGNAIPSLGQSGKVVTNKTADNVLTKLGGKSTEITPGPKVTPGSSSANVPLDVEVPAYIRQGKPDPVTKPKPGTKTHIKVQPGETMDQAIQRTKSEQEFSNFLKGQGGQSFGTAGGGRGGQGGPTASQATSGSDQLPIITLSNGQKMLDPYRVSPSGQYTGRKSIDQMEYEHNMELNAMSKKAQASAKKRSDDQAARERELGLEPGALRPRTQWEKDREAGRRQEEERLGLKPGSLSSDQVKEAKPRKKPEVEYDDEYDAMVARVKKLAGLGPMKTVYDPAKRQYRNMPTAVQPKK